MKKQICIDARMASHSGIGTYIRSILPRIRDFYHLRILIDPETARKYSELSDIEQIPTSPSFTQSNSKLHYIYNALFLPHVKLFDFHKQTPIRLAFDIETRRA